MSNFGKENQIKVSAKDALSQSGKGKIDMSPKVKLQPVYALNY